MYDDYDYDDDYDIDFEMDEDEAEENPNWTAIGLVSALVLVGGALYVVRNIDKLVPRY